MAASVRQHSLLSGSHLQPIEWPQVAASGHQWPPACSSHRQPLAATCSHLQPTEWPPVAASVRPHSLFIGNHLQPLAATCSQSSGRKWPQVAASGRKWPPERPQVAAFAKIKFVPFCTLSEMFSHVRIMKGGVRLQCVVTQSLKSDKLMT